jgi:hypothetical protein
MHMRMLALALLCAACSSATTTSTATSRHSSPSSPVHTFKSTRFTAAVPAGWRDATADQHAVSSVNSSGQVLMLLVTEATTLNEHIDVSVAEQPVPDDQLAGYLQSVAQNGATSLGVPRPFSVDGSTGIYITYNLMSTGGTLLEDQDMVVNHGGDTFDIVLNTAQGDFMRQLADVQTILSTWKWAS